MDYTQLTADDKRHMAATIGIESIEALFKGIPPAHRVRGLLDLPPAMTEIELLQHVGALGEKNRHCDGRICFLGAGSYDHFIPTVVDHLAGQSEFVTAYTPYQAEASQGSLQAFYEFQTLICQLTGMDIANASLYEMTTALAEAVLMARNITGKRRIVFSAAIHPDAQAVLKTYLHELPLDPVPVAAPNGPTDLDELAAAVDEDTAAVVIQTPNFFGCVESLDKIAPIAHQQGALFIVSVDPISCGLFRPPGEFDADIVVGEGQPLGIPMSLGGPYLGLMACKRAYLRKMPGRLVGQTTDEAGRRAFCLTLQTREQHIRRERATSNVCTNQGLLALRAAIYLAAVGKRGLAKIAGLCLDKAHYAADRIASLNGFDLRFRAPFFKEFVLRTRKDVNAVIEHCRGRNILAGVPLGRWHKELTNCLLIAVTEKRTKQDIDLLVEALDSA